MADSTEHPGAPLLSQVKYNSIYSSSSNGNAPINGLAGSTSSRAAARSHAYHHAYSRHGSMMSAQEAGRNSQYTAVLQALVSPPNAIAMNDEYTGGFCKQQSSRNPRQTAPRRPRRGTAIVQWVWPSITEQPGMYGASYNRSGELSCGEKTPEREVVQRLHQQPQIQQQQQQQQQRLHGRIRKPSSVVIGKVCEPVRPTRLDLNVNEGCPPFSRVIYTAKGGYTNPADAPASSSATRPSPLKFMLHSPHEVPWLDSAGTSVGGGGEGWGRTRVHSANSASAAGLKSPRYLRSTSVSQAKAVEPGEAARVARKIRSERSSCRGRLASVGARPSTPRKGSDNLKGNDNDSGKRSGGAGAAGGVAWGAGGMLESLGGFLGIRKGSADSMDKEIKRGKMTRSSRTEANKAATRSANAGGKLGSKVLQRLRKPTDGEGKVLRTGSFRLKVPRAGARKAHGADTPESAPRVTRRDEREVLTMHTHGVQRPEGLKLRVVKASGRTLEETKFHMEIRTLRPGQVWSVCRRHEDFQKLHACLQRRFPALALPRLPRPPSGAGVLDPATLERTRAGLQSYAAAIVADVPVAWGLEEFVMFLDSDEKGRRLFGKKRKKETRKVNGRSPVPEEQDSKSSRKAGTRFSAFENSSRGSAHEEHEKTLLDLKVEEKKKAMAELEGEAQNHFEGVGAVINNDVSFSDDDDDDEDLGFDDDGEFIDGEEAIRAMLDRDAKETEDDNLFNIPAGTDFGAPLDDDDDFGDDDFDIDCHG